MLMLIVVTPIQSATPVRLRCPLKRPVLVLRPKRWWMGGKVRVVIFFQTLGLVKLWAWAELKKATVKRAVRKVERGSYRLGRPFDSGLTVRWRWRASLRGWRVRRSSRLSRIHFASSCAHRKVSKKMQLRE